MKFDSIYLLHGKGGSPNGTVRLLEDALRALFSTVPNSYGRACPTLTFIGPQRPPLSTFIECKFLTEHPSSELAWVA